MFTFSRGLTLATTLGMFFHASVCASAQLYDEARDKQGAAAKKAWEAFDIDSVIAVERGNLKTLLDSELETQDRLAATIRNNRLHYMVGATVNDGLVDPVEKRLVALVVDKEGDIKGAMEAINNTETPRTAFNNRQNKFIALQPDFDAQQLGTPSCASVAGDVTPEPFEKALASSDPLKKGTAEALLDELRKTCRGISDDTGFEVYKDLQGEIGKALQRYMDEQTALVADRSTAEKAKGEYKKALEAYKQAQSDTSPDATRKVQEAAVKLDKAVNGLEGLQNAASAQFLSQERLKSLQAFIKTVTSAKDGMPSADASKAAVALVIVPALADTATQSLADAKQPLALPLLIQRDHEQLQLEAANRDIAARQAQIELSRKVVETLFEEAQQLGLAYRDLTTVDKGRNIDLTRFGPMKFIDAFNKASPDEKELLYISAVRYLDVLYRYDATRYKQEYMRVAAIHEQALAYAEINAKQWQSLIGATVNQLAEYGAGGIKADTVANLLNAAGVLWIGHGVNK
ncbi:MAG: hypothetical protein K0M66_07615 [Thiobacillus sp.]|nr:hypothetical protein [Thiobacillus sp.]